MGPLSDKAKIMELNAAKASEDHRALRVDGDISRPRRAQR
jgi:hypothetical protein